MTHPVQPRCRYNYSRTLTNCSNLKALEWPDDGVLIIIQLLVGVLGAIAFILNCFILLESKNASGGQSPSLVFIRSLMVADALIGLFGIVKAIYIEYRNIRAIDCFLSESLLITASTASAFCLLWLTADSSLKLARPLDLQFHMHKKNVIALMVIVWNGSFIVGFISQMGWVSFDCTCLFFSYYDPMYLLLVSILWELCIVVTLCLLIYNQYIYKQIKNNEHFLTFDSKEYKKYTILISTSRTHIVVWLVTYLPLILYVTINYICQNDRMKASYTILYFLPLPLVKSIVCAALHAYQTKEIFNVLTKHWQNFAICCWRCCYDNRYSTYNISVVGDRQLATPLRFSQQTVSSSLSTEQLDTSLVASSYDSVTKHPAVINECCDNFTFGNGSPEMITRL